MVYRHALQNCCTDNSGPLDILCVLQLKRRKNFKSLFPHLYLNQCHVFRSITTIYTREGWSWLGKYIRWTIPAHQSKERKHWHWDGRTEKIRAVQLRIKPKASDFVHQCSDHWAIIPQLLTTLNIPALDVYQYQRYTVGWLLCCSVQPTAADIMRCYVVFGLTKNKSYE